MPQPEFCEPYDDFLLFGQELHNNEYSNGTAPSSTAAPAREGTYTVAIIIIIVHSYDYPCLPHINALRSSSSHFAIHGLRKTGSCRTDQSTLRAAQSVDCTNPCLAPSISIIIIILIKLSGYKME